jgi:hypothetical protein
MVPGGPPVSQERWAELAREWFPAFMLDAAWLAATAKAAGSGKE